MRRRPRRLPTWPPRIPPSPDANANVDDAWTITLGPNGGRGSFQGFAELGIGSAWAMFSYPIGGINGTAQADHTFVGGALAAGQSVRLDFANSAIAAGASVGVSLTSGGSPVATFKFVGNDPLGVYRYDDLGGTDQNTGEPFAYRSPASFEFSVNSAGNYTAAYGLSSWSGSYSGSIDGIRLFNNAGGDGSDVIFNNMVIGGTSLVPLTLEVNKSNNDVKIKGHASLLANIDYYQITSAASALDQGLWNSLDEQDLFAIDGDDPGSMAGDSPTEGWDAATNANDGRLTEYFLRDGGARQSPAAASCPSERPTTKPCLALRTAISSSSTASPVVAGNRRGFVYHQRRGHRRLQRERHRRCSRLHDLAQPPGTDV